MTDATELDEAAIRARLEAATPAPWEVGDGWVYTLPVYEDDNRLSDVLGMKFADLDRQQQERARAQANAEFIAHARTDVERLLTALDEARAELHDEQLACVAHSIAAVEPIAKERDEALARAEAAEGALAAVRALDRGHVGDGCRFPDDDCRCCVSLFELRAALATPTTTDTTTEGEAMTTTFTDRRTNDHDCTTDTHCCSDCETHDGCSCKRIRGDRA